MQILKLFRHEKEITSLTSSVRIFDRWRSKVCPPLTWSCSVDTKAFRKNKQNKRLQKQICKYQNGSSNRKNNGYKSIALPSISRARSPVSRILQAAEDTKYQTNYQWTAAGKPRQFATDCSVNSHPAASWTLAPSWPPSRPPPCSLSASTPPAAACGSSEAPPMRPSPSRSACRPPGAAAGTWRWQRLRRSARATQPNSGKGNKNKKLGNSSTTASCLLMIKKKGARLTDLI